MTNIVRAVLFVIVALTGCCANAWAAGNGVVCVHVATADLPVLPIASARVFIIGTGKMEAYTQETDASGLTCFEGLNDSTYRVTIEKAGYGSRTIATRALLNKIVTVAVGLQAALQTIATTVSRPAPNAAVQTIRDNSVAAKISPDLVSAMNSFPGVRVSAGAGGLGTVASIGGMDPSMTSYQINGVSVGNGAALGVNTDLLSQAEIDSQNDTIDYAFLGPTDTPEFHTYANQGGFGSSLLKQTMQGTAGQVGFAFAHSARGANSALNGQYFEDASGLDYRHIGDEDIIGNFGTMTIPVGSWNVALSDAVSNSVKAPIPNYFAGPLPAGFGPGELALARSTNPLLVANGAVGEFAVSISAASWGLRSLDDYSTRLIFGEASPFTSGNDVGGSDFSIAGTRADDRGSLSMSLESKAQTYTYSATGLPTTSGGVLQQEYDLWATRKFGTRISTNARLALIRSAGQVSPALTTGVQWTGTHGARANASFNVGSRFVDATALTGALGLTSVASATFDCTNGTISIEAPGDTTARPTSLGYSLGYGKTYRTVSVAASVHDERIDGTILTDAAVAASALPPGAIPSGFLGQLQNAYTSVGSCGAPPPQPANIFFDRNVGGVSADYRGADVHVVLAVSKTLAVDVQYALTQARLICAPSEFNYPLSPYILGGQLPNVPLSELNVTGDWHATKRVEALANFDFTSRNNPDNLPSYGQVNGGLRFVLSPNAAVSLVAANVTNTYVGYFVSPTYSVPLPTVGGSLPTLAAPLSHSVLYVQLHFALGADGVE